MKCAVGNCKQSNSQKSTVSFYSFPKDAAQSELWIKFCNRWKTINVQKDKICALHFKQEDFERNLKYEMGFSNRRAPKLKPGAVPSISTIAVANENENKKQTLEMKVSMLGKAVYEWIRRMMYYKDILLTDSLIQELALQFKNAMGLQDFFPYKDWCDKFRTSYNIPTCDSKTLDIAYTQGRSVQIKDVMKHVLSECSPDSRDVDAEIDINGRDEEENGMTTSDNNCISIHGDKGEMSIKTTFKKNINKNVQAYTINETPSKLVQLVQHTQLQGIRQLMALPLQANGIPGMGQKVLIATPIVPYGQNQGNAPMTMTIIPLATFAQPANTTSKPLNNSNNNVKDHYQQVTVPPPILEIKKEIKEEPEDEYNDLNTNKEYLTDYDFEEDVIDKHSTKQNTNTPTHVAIHLINKDMIQDSTNDSLDDFALSSLKKRRKTEDTFSSKVNKFSEFKLSSPQPDITVKPTLNRNISLTSSSLTMSLNQNVHTLPPLPSINSAWHESQKIDEHQQQQTLPAIRSYTEARKYLKLLEDFALERENFRLIGLITRVDEVLRELDCQENSVESLLNT